MNKLFYIIKGRLLTSEATNKAYKLISLKNKLDIIHDREYSKHKNEYFYKLCALDESVLVRSYLAKVNNIIEIDLILLEDKSDLVKRRLINKYKNKHWLSEIGFYIKEVLCD